MSGSSARPPWRHDGKPLLKDLHDPMFDTLWDFGKSKRQAEKRGEAGLLLIVMRAGCR